MAAPRSGWKGDSPAATCGSGNCNSRPGIRNCGHEGQYLARPARDTEPAASHAVRSGSPARQCERGGARVSPQPACGDSGGPADRARLRGASHAAQLFRARAHGGGARGGSTVIGAMPLARSVLVPRAVLEFAALRPEHAISILDGPYESMLAALRRGSADVLIGALRDPIPFDDILQEHLFDDPLAIVVGS